MNVKIKYFFISLGGFIIFWFCTNHFVNKWRNTFTEISNKDFIDCLVTHSLNDRGYTYVWTNNDKKIMIPICLNEKKESLSLFLEEGDSLKKEQNSLEILVIRNNESYYFDIKLPMR